MRRACLDITGQIPLPHSVRVFEEAPSPDKRPRLIVRLLESDDYAQYWANLWTQWLIAGLLPEPAHRERFRDCQRLNIPLPLLYRHREEEPAAFVSSTCTMEPS